MITYIMKCGMELLIHSQILLGLWLLFHAEIKVNPLSERNPRRQGIDVVKISPGHDDVINGKQFPRYWPFVRGIHRSPVNSPHKGRSDADLWRFLWSASE